MPHLLRLQARPNINQLSDDDRRYVEEHFVINERELIVDGRELDLSRVTEVEVVKAARQRSPAGWIVKNLLYAGERYHVGIYMGRDEAVLPNVTLEVARYVVQSIAFFAWQTINYSGIEGISPVSE